VSIIKTFRTHADEDLEIGLTDPVFSIEPVGNQITALDPAVDGLGGDHEMCARLFDGKQSGEGAGRCVAVISRHEFILCHWARGSALCRRNNQLAGSIMERDQAFPRRLAGEKTDELMNSTRRAVVLSNWRACMWHARKMGVGCSIIPGPNSVNLTGNWAYRLAGGGLSALEVKARCMARAFKSVISPDRNCVLKALTNSTNRPTLLLFVRLV